MRTAFAIYDSGAYTPGVNRLVKDLVGYGCDVIVRSADDTDIPEGDTTVPWLKKSFAWFEVLGWGQYDRVIVLDADLLIIGDISYLLSDEITGHFGMCPASRTKYQAGVVVVNRSLFDSAKLLSDLVPMIRSRHWPIGDQELLCTYLEKNKAITAQMLPKEYNWLQAYGDATPDTRILHFHGVPKPWEEGYTKKHPYWRYWYERKD
jgi:alpha-N-acetylglucosamine transferase